VLSDCGGNVLVQLRIVGVMDLLLDDCLVKVLSTPGYPVRDEAPAQINEAIDVTLAVTAAVPPLAH
jgi:hypothetical protein